ncbi:MAG: hypothetical protein INQ03_23420 [Candidatus Heimdallarchaeota archaeon]|nr:hypothetical protein [Candidatus Heimdallarchaeota archaeon]
MIIPVIIPQQNSDSKESVSAIAFAIVLVLLGIFIASFLTLGPSSTILPVMFLILVLLVTGILLAGISIKNTIRESVCDACGQNNEVDAIYCITCGTSLKSIN